MNTTILIIKQDNKVLLGRKKRGFAQGAIIGIGGKQENGEPIDMTMIRETEEEICVTPIEYKRVGKILFDTYYKGRHEDLVLNIYICTEFIGNPTETEEMEPIWFEMDKIPYEKMLEDDILWMEKILNGEYVAGTVKFSPELVMQECTIHTVNEDEFIKILNENN